VIQISHFNKLHCVQCESYWANSEFKLLADIILVQLLGPLTVQHNIYCISFYYVHSKPQSVQ